MNDRFSNLDQFWELASMHEPKTNMMEDFPVGEKIKFTILSILKTQEIN